MYMSAKEAARKWNISERRVRILCAEGRVDGVQRSAWAWNIPIDTPKPSDGRQLRHMKNHDLRIGGIDFALLDAGQKKLAALGDRNGFISEYRRISNTFLLSSFASEELSISDEDLGLLLSHCFVPEVEFDTQILALNFHALLLRMADQGGLGPLQGSFLPSLSEQRLHSLYQALLQGIGPEFGVEYRKSDDMDTPFTIQHQVQTLFMQYERDWKALHPVVRALFLFGELLRIRPFGLYDGLVASLVFANELLCGGFPPVLVEPIHLDEFRAAMVLTRTRGNYQTALRMIEQSLLHELRTLQSKEK